LSLKAHIDHFVTQTHNHQTRLWVATEEGIVSACSWGWALRHSERKVTFPASDEPCRKDVRGGDYWLLSYRLTAVIWQFGLRYTKKKKKKVNFSWADFCSDPAGALHFNGPSLLSTCKEVKFQSGRPDGESFWTFPGARQGSS
jgi:hypothetical protein